MLHVPGSGPKNAEIVIIGEAPGSDEEVQGMPFIGMSGKELDRMLKEAGIRRDDCYVTNVVKYRPPDNEMAEWCHEKKTIGMKAGYTLVNGRWCHPLVVEGLNELKLELNWKPRVVIGLGNMALWAMTGEWGIGKWRGSEMTCLEGIPFVPTLHPASVLRNWATRPYVVHDLKQRVANRLENGFIKPKWNFNIAPTYAQVISCIENLSGDVALDVETANGHILCLGIAWSDRDAMCIPFHDLGGKTWGKDEWNGIVAALKAASGKARIYGIGQNWNYDAQYFKEDFNLNFMVGFDTYIAQSVLYPGVERSLGFLASMYCDWYCYWKEDAKDWGKVADFSSLFTYNCRDACATWEAKQKQRKLLLQARLIEQFDSRMEYSYSVFNMMVKGVNRDAQRTKKMDGEVSQAITERELLVAEKAGQPVNFASPKQVGDLFYKQLGCLGVKKRGTGKVSTDDEALSKISERYPQHKDLALAILEARSLSSIRANFLRAKVDPDGRFRSGWMATGTETFRLTSSGNAFYRGGPLQNVTDGKHTHSGRKLPNLRSTIIPDYGYTMFNCDLERADLQVVIWEANDIGMMQMMKEHVDVHTENAKAIFSTDKPTEQQRHFGKTFVHLTNYGGSARTCAVKVGCTVHQADNMQKRWFEAHPGILDWHRRTGAYLMGTRTVTNRFGYRRIYFDRVDGLLPEALAWVPQSTVSILISLMQMRIEEVIGSQVEILMQGHDSLVGQYKTFNEAGILELIKRASHVAVPYDDPLYIPLELATSTSSWGEVVKRAW